MNQPIKTSNTYFDRKGSIKIVGYKSLRGLIAVLKRANRNALKLGVQTELTIKLPIKP